ncbi:DNA polymerase III PolC-type [Tetrabaena socialis]|uniref:DNA polymerase III PolC-type n=1 Tax=Tetrabaena socialis TaxID=47790 RepID=A0A2J8A046_9CHLO|nr:DNA polymerase III PolC-type [Tetrabaena socialis]|eukprot:PNH05885.1 DNA polymerase III PolC-type [Tetrabaena socialis]
MSGSGIGAGAAPAPAPASGLSGGARGVHSASGAGPEVFLLGADAPTRYTVAARPPGAAPPFSVFRLPGMSLAGPAGRQASAEELLAAVAAAEPDQMAVWGAVQELMPYLLSITRTGPLRGFAFDTETTGRNWRTDKVIELAVVDLATGDAFSSLINPVGRNRDVYLTPDIVRLTNITPAMLRPAPDTPSASLAFLCWLYQRCRAAGGVRPTFMGHNVKSFDRYFLARMLGVQGCLLPPSWCVVDSNSLASRWKVTEGAGEDFQNKQLQTLREMYGIPAQPAHRALPDTLVNVAVLAAMLRAHKYGAGGGAGGGALQQQQQRQEGPQQQAEDNRLVQQALNDGTLDFGPDPKDARDPKYDITQLLPWGGGAKVIGVRQVLVVLGSKESAEAAEAGGGKWEVADMLLLKTSRARSIAAGHLPVHHGPDFNSAPADVRQPQHVRHPDHESYELPQPLEPLPADPPKRSAKSRAQAAAEAKTLDEASPRVDVAPASASLPLPPSPARRGRRAVAAPENPDEAAAPAVAPPPSPPTPVRRRRAAAAADSDTAPADAPADAAADTAAAAGAAPAALPAEVAAAAQWMDFGNPRAYMGFRELQEQYSAAGSEWVVRGQLRIRPMLGAKFELASPDVFPAAAYAPEVDRVTAVYRACTPLAATDVAVAAAAVVEAMEQGEIGLPDPLPACAQRELLAVLTGPGPRVTASSSSAGGTNTSTSTGSSTSGINPSSGGAATAVAEVAVPSLLSSYGILHRPTVRHLTPCRVRPGGPPGEAAEAEAEAEGQQQGRKQEALAGQQALPPTLNVYQLAGRVVAFTELFFTQLRLQQARKAHR